MNQFYFVIRKTFRQINERQVKPGLIGISDQELTLEPRFFPKDKNQIDCYQRKYFGFFVLRAAFRGLFLSANYLAAGDRCLKDKLLGPAINNYYTGAYHILGCFLALRGRIVFDNQLIWRDQVLKNEEKFVIASFSKGNWHLNFKAWGHSGKWQELKALRLKEWPDSFKNLFKYWYRFRSNEKVDLQRYIEKLLKNESPGTPLEIDDITDEFLNQIGAARHIALYGSFGSNPDVVGQLVNGDTFSDAGIDLQARQYKAFSYSFLNECIVELVQLLNFIRANKYTRGWLGAAIFQPWYDIPDFDKLENTQVTIMLKKLREWLVQTRQKLIKSE